MLTVSSTILQVNHLQQLSGNNRKEFRHLIYEVSKLCLVFFANNLQTLYLDTISRKAVLSYYTHLHERKLLEKYVINVKNSLEKNPVSFA